MLHKTPRTICIDGRFIWHTDDFRGWNELLKDARTVTLLPYRGWAPALLVGDGKVFFEVWKNVVPEELLEDGELCVCTEKDVSLPPEVNDCTTCFRVCRKDETTTTLQDKMTIYAACSLVLSLLGNSQGFKPSAVCTKGQGRLKSLMADPKSAFIIAPCWKTGRQEGGRLVPVDGRENLFPKAPVLDLFDHVQVGPLGRFQTTPCDQVRRSKLRKRLETELRHICKFKILKLRCGGRTVYPPNPQEHNPCWKYTVTDCESDSACFVLKPGYTSEGFEALKKAVLDRMSYLGLDAVFVKEQEECYGLGCRTTETILEYLGDSVIRLPRNYGERIPLGLHFPESLSPSAKEAYSVRFYVDEHRKREGRTPFVLHVPESIPLAEKMRFSLRCFLERLYSIGQFGFAKVENLPQNLESFVKVPFIEEEINRGSADSGGPGMYVSTAFDLTLAHHPIRRSQWEQIDL